MTVTMLDERAAMFCAQTEPRGPVSAHVLSLLMPSAQERPRAADLSREALNAAVRTPDILEDDDLQLALFLLYAASSAPENRDDSERSLVRVHAALEEALERRLREWISTPKCPARDSIAVADFVSSLSIKQSDFSLYRFVATSATSAQVAELLINCSILVGCDSKLYGGIAVPRCERGNRNHPSVTRDEVGSGRSEDSGWPSFRAAMTEAGLDPLPGRYLNNLHSWIFAVHNVAMLLRTDPRLEGAWLGHATASQLTMSVPALLCGAALRRLGFSEDATAYFDRLAEWGIAHEGTAGHELAGARCEAEPHLLPEVLLGVGAQCGLKTLASTRIMEFWDRGESSLREPLRVDLVGDYLECCRRSTQSSSASSHRAINRSSP